MIDDDAGGWPAMLPPEVAPETWANAGARPAPEALDTSHAIVRMPVMVIDTRKELEPLIAAVEGFASELRQIALLWRLREAPRPSDERLAMAMAQGAAMALLRATYPHEPTLEKPFEVTLTSLNEIEQNRPVEAFAPRATFGTPAGVPEPIAAMRGHYAAAMELIFRKLGRGGLRDAARKVARAIPKGSPVWERGRAGWEGVKEWRDRAVKVEGSGEKEAFEVGLALAEKIGADAAIERLLHSWDGGGV